MAKKSLKQMVAALDYTSNEEYFESLISEYDCGNLISCVAEFGNLRADAQKAFLKYLTEADKFDAYDFFKQFM